MNVGSESGIWWIGWMYEYMELFTKPTKTGFSEGSAESDLVIPISHFQNWEQFYSSRESCLSTKTHSQNKRNDFFRANITFVTVVQNLEKQYFLRTNIFLRINVR